MTQLDNPYVGPRTFTRQESSRFFGREREARDLFSLVVSERLVLFYAQSGAGKSSLINARLIPQLQEVGFAVLPIGRVSGELPAGVKEVGNIFIFNLMLSLEQSGGASQRFTRLPLTDFLARLVSADGEHYIYEAEALRPVPNETLQPAQDESEAYVEAPHVLIIDQFEEIITTHSTHWPEREDFFRQLDQAMTDDPLLWVVLTFREDYLAAIEPYAPLLTDKMRARFYIQRMDYESALEAVKKPAEPAGRPFAAGVAESLVDNLRQVRAETPRSSPDTGGNEAFPPYQDIPLLSPSFQGGLRGVLGQFVEPVQLQVVCYQLWENLKTRPPGPITPSDLQELGNVDRALAVFYEQALAKSIEATGAVEPSLRNWFERKLITEAGTRGSVYRGKETAAGLSTRTADFLVNQFVLRTESRAGGIWYELVHDRLVEPILQANKEWRSQLPPVVQLAEAWINSGENKSKLLEGELLRQAMAAKIPEIGRFESVRRFLEASQAAQQDREVKDQADKLKQTQALAKALAKAAQRQRWIIVALALVVLTLVAFVGVLMYALNQRREVLITHDAINTLLALDGRLYISVDSDRSTVKLTDTARQRLLYTLTGHRSEVTKLNLSPDSSYLATSDSSGTTIVWNLQTGQSVATLTGHTETIRYVVFSHDGRLLATGGDDGTTHLWDTSTWQQTFVLRSDGGSIISVAFWPDDSLLVTATTEKSYTIWNPWTGEKVASGRQ